jgi:hypothetical protein
MRENKVVGVPVAPLLSSFAKEEAVKGGRERGRQTSSQQRARRGGKAKKKRKRQGRPFPPLSLGSREKKTYINRKEVNCEPSIGEKSRFLP